MTTSSRFSRRDFLKLSGSALGGFCLSNLGLPAVLGAESAPRLGRVAYNKVTVYDAPSKAGNKVRTAVYVHTW